MLKRIIRKTAAVAQTVMRSLTAHPVEMLIALHACIAMCVLDTDTEYPHRIAPWMRPALLAAIFFVTAYCLNVATVRRGRARMLYRLWLIPYAATALWAGVAEWVDTTEYAATNIGLLPLLVLTFRMRRDNARFIGEAAHTAMSAAVGVTFAEIIHLLFWLTYQSVIYIFDLDPVDHIGTYSGYTSLVVLAPAIFFAMQDNPRMTHGAGGTVDMLMNCIITPALLIYTAILYIYAGKILLLWSLPKGGVANMIFAFTITAMAAKAMQQFVGRKRFRRYFDNFSLIALPLMPLFWTGSLRRVAEYGLTEWRYYMILCGIIMTLCIVLFLSRRTGRYLTVALAAFALLFCSTYIPPLRAGKMAVDSQVRRARRAAGELGILNDDGTLRLGPKSEADTLHRALHRRLYQSLDYVGRKDSGRLAEEFGIRRSDDYLATLSNITESYALQYREDAETVEVKTADSSLYIYYDDYRSDELPGDIPVEGYGRIAVNAIKYRRLDENTDKNDGEVALGDRRMNMAALLDSLLAQSGFSRSNMPTEEWLGKHAKEFLTYRSDSLTIVFERMTITMHDGEPEIESAEDIFSVIK